MISSSNVNSLLIEFLCEELPPYQQEQNIGGAFANAVYGLLQSQDFLLPTSKLISCVSPRRFACIIEGVHSQQDDKTLLRKGPAIQAGLVNGEPTPALLGFAKSCATTYEKLEQNADGYFYFKSTVKGKSLATVLESIIHSALKKIPIAKVMRWGDNDYQFVRPVHNLVVMLNHQLVECNALGLAATNTTLGHRFMTSKPIQVKSAQDYLTQIQLEGKVIAEFAARRTVIETQLQDKARTLGLTISPMPGLLDEVTALVEWPEVLVGSFAEQFLAVPQECLILSMAKNQKYFALVDKHGKLSNHFLFVANLQSHNPQAVINGNQKVLSARLNDAKFFYEFDSRTQLKDLASKLNNVVYHNQLGSQLERSERLAAIAAAIAPKLGVSENLASHTCTLLKADLVSEMVGEFPELQGVMGKYYAQASGETNEVATAIEEHYSPRFSGDELPSSNLAKVVALADKLETLIGIWGIGLIPSGDKDPYALRRAALGIIRILLVSDLDLKELLELTFKQFATKNLASSTVTEVYSFMLQRLANYLTMIEGFTSKTVNATISSRQLQFDSSLSKKITYLPSLLENVRQFAVEANNQSLFEANRRIENILKKNASEIVMNPVDPQLLVDAAEKNLFEQFKQHLAPNYLTNLIATQNWQAYFTALSQIKSSLEDFFTKVMVMCDDSALRINRLNLLASLHSVFNEVIQLSELI